jgi:hypothetical protein
MINSTSSQQGASSAAAVDLLLNTNAQRPRPSPEDQVSTVGSEMLRAKLAAEPEIRPEAVAKGRDLAADPGYPSLEIIRGVASKILASPDPSEDPS